MKQLAAIQLVGNAAALLLGYYWLSIGEARAGLLVWSATVALFTAALFLWIHAAGLSYGLSSDAPYRAALRRLPVLLIAAIVTLLLYVVLGKLQDACADPSFRFASWMTLKLRKPIKPAAVLGVVSAIFWLIRWIVLPNVFLPLIRAAATWRRPPGLRGGPVWTQRLLTPPLLLAALWLPFRILHWRPLMSNFPLEMASFILRAAIAYLLFTAGLLALEGMPLFTQRNKAASP
ncbi:MAG: hypothetical protein WBY44_08520 [Bryobacteraceae bacterium]|jgi:hypothetical protein